MKKSELINMANKDLAMLKDNEVIETLCLVNDQAEAMQCVIKEAAKKGRPIGYIAEVYQDLGKLLNVQSSLSERLVNPVQVSDMIENFIEG